VIMITGTGDHFRPEWPITITGMRNLVHWRLFDAAPPPRLFMAAPQPAKPLQPPAQDGPATCCAAQAPRRSTLAKRIGLGRIPQEAVASTPTPAVVAHRRIPKLRQITVAFGCPEPVETLRATGEGRTDQERITDAVRQRVIAVGAASAAVPATAMPDPSAGQNRQHPPLKTSRLRNSISFPSCLASGTKYLPAPTLARPNSWCFPSAPPSFARVAETADLAP
jgi:hypothetical protein